MRTKETRILFVCDNESESKICAKNLQDGGLVFSSIHASSKEELHKALKGSSPDLVLADSHLQSFDDLIVIDIVRKNCPDVPIVFVTDSIGEEVAVEMFEKGAADVIFKSHLARLAPTIKRVLSEAHERAEKMRCEHALLESEERYRIIVETAAEGIWTLDNYDRITFVNRRMGEMLGYEPEELVGKEPFELMDDEWKVTARSDIENLRRGGRERHDFKFKRKDSTDLWAVVSSTPLFDSSRLYAGALQMISGISERRRVEEASRVVENKYRKLMETANDAIFLADAETGTIIDANKKAEEMLGLPLEKIIGMNQMKLHPKTKGVIYRRMFEQHVKDGTGFADNAYLATSDGQHIPVEIRASLVNLGGKKIMQAIFRDVTDRKTVEDKLRMSDERMRAIVNNSPALVYGRDLDGKYVFVNKAFEKLAHLKEKRLIGNTPYDIFSKEVADMFQAADVKVLETGSPLETEETLPLPDGMHTYMTSKFPLLDSEGKIYAMCSIATDITQRKIIEQECNKKIEELMALVAKYEAAPADAAPKRSRKKA